MEQCVKIQVKQYRSTVSFLAFRCSLRYVLQGRMRTQHHTLEPSSLWLQRGSITEDLYAEPGTIVLEAELNSGLLYAGVTQLDEFLEVRDNGTILRQLLHLLELRDGAGVSALEYTAAAYGLLAQLQKQLEHATTGDHSSSNARRREIAAYLQHHFSEPITLEGLAKEFHLSGPYFSRWFHRQFRIPLREYLQRLRLNEACYLLATTNESITAIAERCGFPNYNAMANAFRLVYQVLPSEYRTGTHPEEDARESASLLSHTDISGLIRDLSAKARLTQEPQHTEIAVNVREYGTMEARWSEVLNCGFATDCLQADVQRDIAYLKERFGFRYLRLGSLLVRNLIPNKLGTSRFDYSLFFRLIDFMDTLGLQPMLDMAVKPVAYAGDIHVETEAYDGNHDFWLHHFSMFLSACAQRYPKEKMNQWRFEFWLPQYWEQEIPTDRVDRHATLFFRAREMIRAVAPEASVGGPGMLLVGPWEKALRRWFRQLGRAGVTPDFLTFGLCAQMHSSRTTLFGGTFQMFSIDRLLPMEQGSYQKRWETMGELAREAFGRLPEIYAFETASEPVCLPTLKDGAYPAAFLVKSFLELEPWCSSIFIPAFKNRDVDYGDENMLTCGGNGLLLRHQLKSTVFFAYDFLSRLGGRRIAGDANYVFTQREDGSYAVLFHNCKLHSPFFSDAFAAGQEIGFSDARLYENNLDSAMTLRLQGLEPGEYQIREQLISDDHGCLAAEVNRLNYSGQFTPDILNYLEKVTRPFMRFSRHACQKTLEFSVVLQPNDILLLEIRKI